MSSTVPCRMCGACCIAPSISSPIPGMPEGKPAGVRCIHRRDDGSCAIYAARPAVCAAFSPTRELCGASFAEAMQNLALLEELTK